jgi:hypothetical protein
LGTRSGAFAVNSAGWTVQYNPNGVTIVGN